MEGSYCSAAFFASIILDVVSDVILSHSAGGLSFVGAGFYAIDGVDEGSGAGFYRVGRYASPPKGATVVFDFDD